MEGTNGEYPELASIHSIEEALALAKEATALLVYPDVSLQNKKVTNYVFKNHKNITFFKNQILKLNSFYIIHYFEWPTIWAVMDWDDEE